MRVLLIEPRSCWVGLSTGLAYVAAALRAAGHEVQGISLTNHREYPPNRLQRHFVESFRPDLVGYSVYYTSVHAFGENLRDLRTYYHGPVVAGGPQLNIEREQLLHDHPDLDYAIVGEAEEAIVELCRALDGQQAFSAVAGLIHRVEGRVAANALARPNRQLDDLPLPDFTPFGVQSMRTYYIASSRGCPYRCTYCNRNSDNWRARSPESMIRELKHAIQTYQCRDFCITDDSFNVRPDRIIQFCDLLDREGIRMPWLCSGARADRLEERMLARMRATGCHRLSVGVESLQPEVYQTLNKGESLEEIAEGIRRAKSHGFKVFGYFMIGIPGDTRQGVLETYRRAQHLGLDVISFSILLPFPETPVHRQLLADPRTRWLRDYRTVTTAWTFDPEWSEIKSSFELPDFPEGEKVDLFHRLRTKQGDPRPPYHRSKLLFGLHVLWYILKYDLAHAPVALLRTARNVADRLIRARGKTVSETVVEYDPSFLPSLAECQALAARPCASAIAGRPHFDQKVRTGR